MRTGRLLTVLLTDVDEHKVSHSIEERRSLGVNALHHGLLHSSNQTSGRSDSLPHIYRIRRHGSSDSLNARPSWIGKFTSIMSMWRCNLTFPDHAARLGLAICYVYIGRFESQAQRACTRTFYSQVSNSRLKT